MCPISLQILNFPKQLRSADNHILLWPILLCPNKAWSLSAYLCPLVDELLLLKDGIPPFDSDSCQSFTLKARCVLNVPDCEGQQMFLDSLGPNAYQGCNKCRQPGSYLQILSKMVYSDFWRFLPSDHPLRTFSSTNIQWFPFHIWITPTTAGKDSGVPLSTNMVSLMKVQKRTMQMKQHLKKWLNLRVLKVGTCNSYDVDELGDDYLTMYVCFAITIMQMITLT